MTDSTTGLFDSRIAAWLEEDPSLAPDQALETIVAAVPLISQRRGLPVPWRSRPTSTSLRFVAGITVIALVAVATLRLTGRLPGVGVVPTPTPAPALVWSELALDRDWPGPVRSEDGGTPRLFRVADFADPSGDTDAPDPWIDITRVTLRTGNVVGISNPIGLELAGGLRTVPDPATTWIAYGVVVDLDGDGRGDQRIGIDNGIPDHREWITDLATGETAVNPESIYGAFGAFGTRIETWFVDANGQVALNVKRSPGGIRFYVWASEVIDGHIVATDFAPDVGWIETVSR